MTRKLIYDTVPVESVRHIDDNGYLHVDVSNITKEQIAPYLGSEIPGFEELGLEAKTIYNVYRPASELSREETIESLNGIPILLKHAPDSAAEPASNRVGSTGTDAKWEAPYLTNSLHIQDADAIARINDGTMKEISMGYYYTPVKKSGTFEGKEYDLIMTDIACNHVALVEEGRAGHDVVVNDEAINANLPAGDGQEDKTSLETQENDMDKEKLIAELLEQVAAAGLDPDEVKAKLDLLIKPVEAADEDDPEQKALNEAFAEGVKYGEEKEKEEPEKLDSEHESEGEKKALGEKVDDECGDLTKDAEEAFKEAGLDEDLKDAFTKGFAAGVTYGEEKEKEEPEKLDSEHESEGMKKALGEDSAEKIAKLVQDKFEAKYAAIEECEISLGKVKGAAFDSAEAVYKKALAAEGLNVKDMALSECKSAYRALMFGKSKIKAPTMDAKKTKETRVSSILSNVRVGE